MTFTDAKALRDHLEGDVDRASERLDTFPKLASGLTPDSAKTPQWHRAKADYDAAFGRLRKFNQWFVRAFKKQLAAERAERRRLNPTPMSALASRLKV